MTSPENNMTRIGFDFPVVFKNQTSEYLSPIVIITNSAWRIKILKRSFEDETVIEASLIGSVPTNWQAFEWKCDAMAMFSVRSVELNQYSNERRILPKMEFSRNCLFSDPIEIMRCANPTLYHCNNPIIFDIQLFVNSGPIQFALKETKIRFEVENVSELGVKYSPEIKIHDVKWNIFVKKSDEQSSDYLSFYLNRLCDEDDTNRTYWSLKVNCTYKLHSFDENVPSIVKNSETVLHELCPDWGYKKFLPWDEFMDQFVQNDTAVFEVEFETEPPTSKWKFEDNPTQMEILEESPSTKIDISNCPICLEDLVKPASIACGHLFCKGCIITELHSRKACPICKTNAEYSDVRRTFL